MAGTFKSDVEKAQFKVLDLAASLSKAHRQRYPNSAKIRELTDQLFAAKKAFNALLPGTSIERKTEVA